MAIYNLTELLLDKDLRTEILKEKFQLCDSRGEFKTLDFSVNSMRKNHILAFEQLYALGGDELFEYILKEGKTCLCDSPDAAKVGVVGISGTDKYFLKANASAIAAFNSILNGLKSLSLVDEFFSTDDIYVQYETEDDDTSESISFDEPEGIFDFFGEETEVKEELPVARNWSLVQKDNKYMFYDEDNKKFADFTYIEDDKEIAVTGVHDIQPIKLGGDGDIVGYKYCLEKNGKWGFVSRAFLQLTAPVFETITASDGNGYFGELFSDVVVFAARKEQNWLEETYKVYFSKEIYLEDDSVDYQIFLKEQESLSFDTDECIPGENPYIGGDWLGDGFSHSSGDMVLLYRPHMENKSGFTCKINVNEEKKWRTISKIDNVVWEKNILKHNDELKIGADYFSVVACKLLYPEKNYDFEVISFISDSKYIIKRDGYYAVAKLSTMKIKEMITPFAFTDIDADKWKNISCVLLDRFGKKGVFDLKNKTYLIPCVYEEIEFLGNQGMWSENVFRVRIMGHEGKIHRDGTWVIYLHPIEE